MAQVVNNSTNAGIDTLTVSTFKVLPWTHTLIVLYAYSKLR